MKSNHRVTVKSHTQDLPKAGSGIEMTIYKRRSIVGRLSVGRGGIRWTPAHKQRPRRLSWTALAALMER